MYSIVRIILLVVCAVSFVLLINRWRNNHATWNTKTRDYWYALTMWTFASAAANLEGLIRHLPGRYSVVFSAMAGLVTLSGVLRKGDWGGRDNGRH
jgi:hypothetical protein